MTTDTVASVAGTTVTPAAKPIEQPLCAAGGNGMRLTRDSIGPLPLWATMDSLRRICPAAVRVDVPERTFMAGAIRFPFAGVRAFAVQMGYGDPPDTPPNIKPERPADQWEIDGAEILLPDGKPFPATLGALRARYPEGKMIVNEDDGTAVSVAALPEVMFGLTYGALPYSADGWRLSDSRLADSLTVVQIKIVRPSSR